MRDNYYQIEIKKKKRERNIKEKKLKRSFFNRRDNSYPK
jgi:hypothetical protein